jgi:DNA-binding PadR family transcriptional regulator
MELASGSPIHKLFLDYIFLNELSKHPNGISGYRIRKVINEILLSQINKNGHIHPKGISQSLVYRVFKALKADGLIDGKEPEHEGRRKILYSLNAKGTKRLALLKRTIQNIAPSEAEPGKIAEDLFAGKISPTEFIPKSLPKDKVLTLLKAKRRQIKQILSDINQKIEELENELA